MRKQEKTQRTRERILKAALAEFGTKTYHSASVNSICSASGLSKGLLYHNFKNKDDLYLCCVALCYKNMMGYIRERECALGAPRADIQTLLSIRQSFLTENPYYSNIFFNTILQPPKHLLSEIGAIRREFDTFFVEYFEAFLHQIPLREGISIETALECYMIFSEMYNSYFRSKMEQTEDYKSLIHAHEERMTEIFDILLYGIAKQSTQS